MKLQTSNFIKKETPTQVFSCEFYQNFKNTYFEEHLPTAAFYSQVVNKNGSTKLKKKNWWLNYQV